MKFLIDTNIVIPLEPTSRIDLEINTELALKFHNLCSRAGLKIFIHPVISYDIARDKNADRKALRETLIQRYPLLKSPPSVSILDPVIVNPVDEGSNCWVDNMLLAALQGDLTDYLVTEDIGIHKKANRMGLGSRVLLLSDAVAVVQDLFDESPPPPPTVDHKYVYELDITDPIFDSLRADYTGFDNWLAKCKRDHREAYVVIAADGKLAGIAILKREHSLPDGKEGKVLKICTFKVSESFGGNRIGELLLKPVFEYARVNNYDYTYFTAFTKQTQLIDFASDFGFFNIENRDSTEEIALSKSLKFTVDDASGMSPLDLHIRFGPCITSFNGNRSFVIPIKPNFHISLFPELGPRPGNFLSLPPKPCGNAIRKAYLCNAPIKKVRAGDNIFFYRSTDVSALTCLGIVEGTLRSSDPDTIAQFVGKRTVYSYSEIEELCSKNEVLAILFRLVCPIDPKIPLRALRSNGIINAQPQSITQLQEHGIEWIRQQIKM
jgi:GNAT superfamily N-acetyltransferase